MDRDKWNRIEQVLDRYNVKPIVAVIPSNEDPKQNIDEYDHTFWEKVKKWQEKGWAIALHGYNHVYTTKHGGLVPINKKSEFAGLPYEAQEEKIKKGISIFRRHGIEPNIWVAPAHTFDKNTLKALKQHTNIQIISDGIALNPYKRYGFTWIPCQSWEFGNQKNGTFTVCLHPNTMSENRFMNLSESLARNSEKMIQISSTYLRNDHFTIADKLFSWSFFIKRRIMKIVVGLVK
jgi:peptidoglycan/xylan/chitin deacetylase (PgdA/CDA1 family)